MEMTRDTMSLKDRLALFEQNSSVQDDRKREDVVMPRRKLASHLANGLEGKLFLAQRAAGGVPEAPKPINPEEVPDNASISSNSNEDCQESASGEPDAALTGTTLRNVTKNRAAKPKRNLAASRNVVRVVKERESLGVVSGSYSGAPCEQGQGVKVCRSPLPAATSGTKQERNLKGGSRESLGRCKHMSMIDERTAPEPTSPKRVSMGRAESLESTVVIARQSPKVARGTGELYRPLSIDSQLERSTGSAEQAPDVIELLRTQKEKLGTRDARAGLLAIIGSPVLKLKQRSVTGAGARERTLLMIKGKQRLRCVKVEMGCESLNHHDAFVLDGGKNLYVFVGRHAARLKHAKAFEIAIRIKDSEYHGNASIIDVQDSGDVESSAAGFWEALKATPESVSASAPEDDKEFEDRLSSESNIYMFCGNGWTKTDGGRRMTNKTLNSQHAYVVEYGNEVCVWQGRGSDETERAKAMEFATNLLREKKSWSAVEVVVDKGERVVFKEKFADFQEGMDITVKPVGNVQRKDKTPYVTGADVIGKAAVDVCAMYENQIWEAVPVDDGSGEIESCSYVAQVWHCTEKEKTELSEAEFGHFFSHESYVVLYNRADKRDTYVMYYWMGSRARANDNGAAAVLALQLNARLGAPQLGSCADSGESSIPDFRSFRIELTMGASMVLENDIQGTCVFVGTRDCYQPTRLGMYQVYGRNDSVRARYVPMQEPLVLSSSSVYIATEGTDKPGFIWVGRNAECHLEEFSAKVLTRLLKPSAPNPRHVHEGSEHPAFFRLLQTKQTDILSSKWELAPVTSWPRQLVRAWVVDNASGEPRAHEIACPLQSDLKATDCVVVDVYYGLYVWVGPCARQLDMKAAVCAGKAYCELAARRDPDRKRHGFPSILVNAGEEPFEFQALFPGWCNTSAQATARETASITGVRRLLGKGSLTSSYEELTTTSLYPLEALIETVEQLPAGVDAAKKEEYLRAEDFASVFKMSREEFMSLPAWKRLQLKKATPLF